MYVVSVKPVDGPGPVLVSDDPDVLRAVVGAITKRYGSATPEPGRAGSIVGEIQREAGDADPA